MCVQKQGFVMANHSVSQSVPGGEVEKQQQELKSG